VLKAEGYASFTQQRQHLQFCFHRGSTLLPGLERDLNKKSWKELRHLGQHLHNIPLQHPTGDASIFYT